MTATLLACNFGATAKGAHSGCPLTPSTWVDHLPSQVLWAASHVYLIGAVLILAAVAWVAVPMLRARKAAAGRGVTA